MNRPIKFRGCDMTGHFVFGLLTKKRIRSSGEIRFAIATGNCSAAETIPVNEDSIAQLVGYDCDGREVYEGDILVDKLSNGFTARLVCRVLDDEGFLLDIPLEQLELTEATT